MTSAQQKKNPLLGLLDGVTKLGVIVGGLFAAWQYWEARSDQRVSRTISYIERYEHGSVGDARRRINAALRPYIAQLQEVQRTGLSEQDRTEIVLSIVEADGGKIADDIEMVVDFFDGLLICTSEGLCDLPSAERYFQSSDAKTIWSNFEPYIASRRTNNPRFGSALEAFIQSTPKNPKDAQ